MLLTYWRVALSALFRCPGLCQGHSGRANFELGHVEALGLKCQKHGRCVVESRGKVDSPTLRNLRPGQAISFILKFLQSRSSKEVTGVVLELVMILLLPKPNCKDLEKGAR
jgi:hypothetical protein